MNTTIAISQDVKKRLKGFGQKGDTYSDILDSLLDSVKDRQLQEILMSTKDTVPIDDALRRAKQKWQK